ncbi:MAG: DNA polymerase III subunit delta', partial [Flavobacteriales bacterium]|nr:DNA polymerase III subunit delta' [Flavobacteriales bacterium]
AENEDQLLKTILSRCQILRFLPLPEAVIDNALQSKFHKTPQEAHQISIQAQGSWNKACQLLTLDAQDEGFEQWFVTWVRAAFKAKGNATVIAELIDWSATIAATGRETQKQFLDYCLAFFRQALLQNYNVQSLVYLQPTTANFSIKKFAPFVNQSNILEIAEAIETAQFHIERNANAKIVLLDLSIKLTRFLHQK